MQHASRARLDAELVLDRGAVNVVALAERAVRIEHDLRHDEQRNPLDAFWRFRRARQDQVHDVLGQVVIAVGDEDLLSEEAIGAVRLRHSARAHLREIRTGLRLGQVHRAGPGALDQPRQIRLLLLIAAGDQQRLDRTIGQQRTQCERQVGRLHHLHARGTDHFRKTLPAELGRMLDALPARLAKRAKRRTESRAGGDLAIRPASRLRVSAPVERRDHLTHEAAVLLEHGLHGFIGRLLAARQLLDLLQSCQFVQHELHVLDRCRVAHESSAYLRGRVTDPSNQPSSLTSCGTSSNRSPTRP